MMVMFLMEQLNTFIFLFIQIFIMYIFITNGIKEIEI